MTRYVVPDLLFDGETLRSGQALEVDGEGRVLRVLDAAQVEGGERLRDQVLLPGLVNAHSHAFQRLIRGRTEYVASGRSGDDFWSWREAMYRAANALDPEGVYQASRQAFVEMALSGITAVGEFHYLHHQPDGAPYADPDALAHQVIRAARDVGLRIALLRVGYARAGYEVGENPRQRRFIDPDPESFLAAVSRLEARYAAEPLVTVGAAPHSVRAVPKRWLEAVRDAAPPLVHVHAAEQPAEIEACVREHGRRPVQLLEELGLLGPRLTAVHAIHLSAEEVQALGSSGANVCACPSTERNLGDGVVPADALLAAGATVSLGTDSQTGIDLLDDARQLESHLRLVRLRRAVLDPGAGTADGVARRLFACATRGGARSLGLHVGALAPGAPADFFTLDLSHPALAGADPRTLLSSIVFAAGPGAVREVEVGGRRIVHEGRHPLAEESGRAFAALSKVVFG